MTFLDQYDSFDSEYPERFVGWGWIDHRASEQSALCIVDRITTDLETAERNLVPGLREALRIIAHLTPGDYHPSQGALTGNASPE